MASSSIVFYKCATCKLYIPQQKACQLMPQMAGTIESDDYCAKYEDTLYTCVDCGAAMLRPLINMVGEEVQRSFLRFDIVQKSGTVLSWVRKGGAADLYVRKAFFQMLCRRDIKIVELLLGAGPGAWIGLPAVIRIVEVRFVPDFPICDAHLVAIRPAFVIMTNDVLADLRPLLIVLRRINAIFPGLVLDTLAESVKRLRPGLLHVQKHHVGIGEIIGLRRIYIRPEIREYLRNIDAVAAVLRS